MTLLLCTAARGTKRGVICNSAGRRWSSGGTVTIWGGAVCAVVQDTRQDTLALSSIAFSNQRLLDTGMLSQYVHPRGALWPDDGAEAPCRADSSNHVTFDTSTWRGRAASVISRAWFDSAVVGLILVNCIFLALDDPTEEVRLSTFRSEPPCMYVHVPPLSAPPCVEHPPVKKLPMGTKILLQSQYVHTVVMLLLVSS